MVGLSMSYEMNWKLQRISKEILILQDIIDFLFRVNSAMPKDHFSE